MKYFFVFVLGLIPTAEAAPFLTCANEEGDRLELGWAFERPFTSVRDGALPKCVNQGDDRTGLVMTYPAQGIQLTKPNGDKVTGWVKIEFTNAKGEARTFYQHSDFVTRTAGCTQGFFRSKGREYAEFRHDEPEEGQSFLQVGRTKVAFFCRQF
jgi:hypothetical protein